MVIKIERMRPLSTLLIMTFFSICCPLPAQENPFMAMAGKRYAEYGQELENEFSRLITLYDTLEFQKFANQIEEVATKTGSMEWKLQSDYYELSLIKMKNHYAQTKRSNEELLGLMHELLKKAQEASVPQIEFRIRYDIIQDYFYLFKNYELAFEQIHVQYQRLQTVSSDDYPEKTDCYIQISNIQ